MADTLFAYGFHKCGSEDMEAKSKQCQDTDGAHLSDPIAQTGDEDDGAIEQEEEERGGKDHSNESGRTKDTEVQF